ncbi:hypothetical protein [Vineibacter terrae]|uniref:hypothetical protein n=1 Tax=Vineibacter terrae TaxID=2586908 RepID=UPI002E321E8D|nr:hypothetical protein [Vineibacter terrae]HEX2888119.1 hypothetical protein [Vineibacter terrae]
MCKTFFVAPGYEAVNRGVWHGAGLLLSVEEDETVAIYTSNGGPSLTCVGTYLYGQLDATTPPPGLIRDRRNDLPESLFELDTESASA